MNIKNTVKREWYVLIILLVPFLVSLLLWNDMPDIVPTHFNAAGEADDYGPKWINAFLLPGIAVITYLFLLFIPKIDPKKRIESAQKPIAAIRILISLFLVGIYSLVMMKSLDMDVNIGRLVSISVGVVILIIGNYMNSIKPNYFIGIRTPWTLENPNVWKKTHRFSSKLWVVGGLVMIISSLFIKPESSVFVIITSTIFLAVIPLLYSYIIFNKFQKSEH